MKKLFTMLTLCTLIFAFCLTGCGEDTGKNNTTDPDQTDITQESGDTTPTDDAGTATEAPSEDEPVIAGSAGLSYLVLSAGDNTCTVNGIGTCTDLDVVIPSHSPEGYRVVRIDKCKSEAMTSVTLHGGIQIIGSSAFEGCTALQTVNFAESGLEEINGYAFAACTSLTHVKIPDSVKKIGINCFNECSNLTSVELGNGIDTLNGLFNKCTKLDNVVIPESVKTITNDCFAGCESLKTVTVPNTVTEIGNGSFKNCTALTAFSFPNALQTIGSGAFMGCSGLTSVEIPDTVTTIDTKAFWVCRNLTSVTFGKSLQTLGERAFSETAVTELMIPDGVTEIGEATFQSCTKLTSVSLPESLKVIKSSAFNTGAGLLNSVEFRGSEAQWKAVEIGEYNTALPETGIKFAK